MQIHGRDAEYIVLTCEDASESNLASDGWSNQKVKYFSVVLSLTLLFFNQNLVDLAILEYTNPLKHATFTHRI